MDRVGFLGLGRMGQAMAQRLAQAGVEVWAWNRTPKRAEGVALKPLEEVASLPLVFSMLADDGATESVLPTLLDRLPPGGVHVGMATLGVPYAQSLAERHRARGQAYVGAPVFGRPEAAARGELRIVVAGAEEAVGRALPYLQLLGQEVYRIGASPHLAHAVKLGGNFLIAGMLEALAEAYLLMQRAGVPLDRFYEVVKGVFRSPVYENYGRILLERRFDPPGFALRLGLKDLNLIRGLAQSAGQSLPLAELVAAHLEAGLARGLGEKDWTSLLEVLEADGAQSPPA